MKQEQGKNNLSLALCTCDFDQDCCISFLMFDFKSTAACCIFNMPHKFPSSYLLWVSFFSAPNLLSVIFSDCNNQFSSSLQLLEAP